MEELKIVEVTTKKQIKDFIELPLNMYKDNPYYVPPIYMDEKAIFKKSCIHNLTCDQIFFVAYRNNKPVGRIQGIIQKQYNEIYNTKKARFSRFHCEDNIETATKLFKEVEKWAKEKGMEEVIGPMGYNDLEREGLLIEGFNYLNTYEEEYNYPYYQKLIESNGYTKDVDWVEFRIYPENYEEDKLEKIANRALKKMKLRIEGMGMNKNKFLKKYADDLFNLIDVCYSPLYGTVPLTKETKKSIIDNFKLAINTDYIVVIVDENDKIIAFGIALPALGPSLQKSQGKLTIPTIINLLKSIKNPKVLDFALVGILPEYQGLGIIAIMMSLLQKTFNNHSLEYVETNLNLETNNKIIGNWKFFKHEQHKRRRSFIKKL
jgi:hypothetical protein